MHVLLLSVGAWLSLDNHILELSNMVRTCVNYSYSLNLIIFFTNDSLLRPIIIFIFYKNFTVALILFIIVVWELRI